MRHILRVVAGSVVAGSVCSWAATATFSPDTGTFANPERGFSHSVEPIGCDQSGAALTQTTLSGWRDGENRITLVRKYYQLKAYRSVVTLPQTVHDVLDADAQACRAAGVKLIPRFIYEWCPTTPETDAPLNITTGHIRQLAPSLARNNDVIAFVEAGFVGQYGEWHHSDYNHIDNYSNELAASGLQIRDELLKAVPSNRFLAMRYMYWHKMKFWPTPLTQSQAFDTSAQARIGYHHDFIMGNTNWDSPSCGECPTYATMHAYYAADTKYALSTGEPCASGDTYYQTTNPCPQLRAIHITSVRDNSCIDYSYWRNAGWMNELCKFQGYRFEMIDATLSDSAQPGATATLRLRVANRGYAAMYNRRPLRVILRNKATSAILSAPVVSTDRSADPRHWLPENGSMTVDMPFKVADAAPAGAYDVLLCLPDSAPSLSADPRFSVRMANSSVWESQTGYNRLNLTLQVAGTTNARPQTTVPRVPGSTMRRCTMYTLRGQHAPHAGVTGINIALAGAHATTTVQLQ